MASSLPLLDGAPPAEASSDFELVLDSPVECGIDDAKADSGIMVRREPSKCMKVFVFVVFTQVVQALMSYDGGATQFSTAALAASGWSPLELGGLGAMDKIGQVATAFVWGSVLMRHDNKPMLAVGLFWKAACCFLFGFLQQHRMTVFNKLAMLAVKLGMGISEALVSVWATVWVQRMAPPDSRARWLGLAGTSAGVGNGVGSGVASLCDPVSAFFGQAAVLFAIFGVLLFLPAHAFRFSGAGVDLDSGEPTDEDASPPRPRRSSAAAQSFLFEEVALSCTASHVITIESVLLPGHFLDASEEHRDTPFHHVAKHYKVRMTQGDTRGEWAHFRMQLIDGNVVTFESIRFPGHFLDAEREKLRITEGDHSRRWAQFRLDRAWNGGPVSIESVRYPGLFVNSSERRLDHGRKVHMGQAGPSAKIAQFVFHEIPHAERQPSDEVINVASRPRPLDLCMGSCCPVEVIGNHLWLWSALSISLCCFVTSGISFLWQNTVQFVWGFHTAWSFACFVFSTGIGGFVGVLFGPKLFDGRLGGFGDAEGKARCLLWCMRLMFVASICSTICTVLLAERSIYLVYSNHDSVVYWMLAVLNLCVFVLFFCVNSVQGTLYGINTEAASPELRPVAAGLTVSFQNVFGYACGPLVPGAFAGFVGASVSDWWPYVHWDTQALDGAKYAAGMGLALAATWLLFMCTRKAALKARVMAAKR